MKRETKPIDNCRTVDLAENKVTAGYQRSVPAYDHNKIRGKVMDDIAGIHEGSGGSTGSGGVNREIVSDPNYVALDKPVQPVTNK